MKFITRLLGLFVVSLVAWGQAPPTPNASATWPWALSPSGGSAANSGAAIAAICAAWASPSSPTLATVGSCSSCTSGSCGGANYNLGGQLCGAHCELGATVAPNVGGYYQSPQCPTSWNLNLAGTACESPLCAISVGKEVDFEVTWLGVEADANPAFGCYAGCKAFFQSGSRFDVTVATGDRYNAFKGIAILSNNACTTGDKAGGALSAFRAVVAASTGLTGSQTGVGGVGSDRGAASGFQQVDGVNLAKIATNTARLVDGLTGGTGGTGAVGTAGAAACGGTGQPACAVAGQCGGTGQPACTVTMDAGDLLADKAAMISAGNADKATGLAALQGEIDTLAGTAPTFTPGGGRWLPSLSSFLPSPECSLSFDVHLPTMGAAMPFDIFNTQVCTWALYLKDFLYWAFALWTLWAVWGAIFERRA